MRNRLEDHNSRVNHGILKSPFHGIFKSPTQDLCYRTPTVFSFGPEEKHSCKTTLIKSNHQLVLDFSAIVFFNSETF